jgi:hypothetical protein
MIGVTLAMTLAPVVAHEAERTKVTLNLSADGTFTLDVANDPMWLLLRLETFAGGRVPANISPEQRDARLAALTDVFADRVVLFVDAHEVRARTVEYVPPGTRGSSTSELSVPSVALGSPEPSAPSVAPGSSKPSAPSVATGSSEPSAPSVAPGSSEPSAPSAALGSPEPSAPSVALGSFRLRGVMPRDATRLRWLYGLVGDRYPLEIRKPDGSSTIEWIDGTDWSDVIDLTRTFTRPTRMEIVTQYLFLGYTHILPKGVDHILFVLGIFLLSPRIKTMLLQVTAFTIAHSITLGLSMYGIVSLTPRVVEPLIALSIAYVAIENLFTRELRPWRLALVFTFGLLHGLGFAGVLRELGLPREQFLTALLTFNLGVEGGQLTVIAAAMLAVAPFMKKGWYRQRVVIPASLMIATVGIYWTVARLLVGR